MATQHYRNYQAKESRHCHLARERAHRMQRCYWGRAHWASVQLVQLMVLHLTPARTHKTIFTLRSVGGVVTQCHQLRHYLWNFRKRLYQTLATQGYLLSGLRDFRRNTLDRSPLHHGVCDPSDQHVFGL